MQKRSRMQVGNTVQGWRVVRRVFITTACLSVASVVATYLVGLRALRLDRELAAQSEEIRKLEGFVSILKDAETGQRGYLLTGNEGYLQPYEAALGKVNRELTDLKQLGLEGRLGAGDAEGVANLTQKKMAELAETIRLRREHGLDAALETVRSGRGEQLMDEIRLAVGRMQERKQAEFDESNRQAMTADFLRTVVFALMAVVNLAFLGWAYGRLGREAAQREAAEVEAQREKELLATTLASIGDGVIVTDAQGRVTLLNGEAERMTGWGSAEAGGKPLSNVFRIENEKTGEMVENPVEKVLRLGRTVGLANHTVLVSRTGNKIPIGDSGAPVRRPEGPVEGVVLVFRDVTVERNGQAAKERLAAIVESADDAMISKTLDGTILTWNQGAERIFGYSTEEAVGKPIMMIIPPERAQEESHILECIRRGERVEHLETVRLASDGRRLDVSLSVSPLRDEEERVVGASKVLRDITDRKRTEAELATSREKLEHHAQELERTVAERTKQLRETVAELEAFCYSLSHDMRAPLRAIQSYSQTVLEEAGQAIGIDCADYLRKAISAAERMDRLIQDVLAFTRLSRKEITLEPLNVDRLVREIVQERPELHASKADVLIEGPLLMMRGHGASLTQCVTNLLENAVKFVAPGVKPRVRVYTEKQDGAVRLFFEDNGMGIEKQAQKRLFGLFQRIHPADQYQGNGVGLAIVRQAAGRMEGQVGFESEAGHGSKFWVELPAVDS